MAGFSNSANRLQPPDFASGGAKLPKVSGHMPKYSHFWETASGDWVRSSLHGGRGGAIGGIFEIWQGKHLLGEKELAGEGNVLVPGRWTPVVRLRHGPPHPFSRYPSRF